MQQTIQPLMFASNLRNEFAIVIFGYSEITKNFLLNNSGRSIPTSKKYLAVIKMLHCFNRINSGSSIPTWKHTDCAMYAERVSIVSIQADQSRRNVTPELRSVAYGFQSYQFRQINPDLCTCL